MGTIFDRGKINEIYFRLGKFPNDVKSKFVHSPVDLLTLDGSLYLATRPFAQATGGLSALVPDVSQTGVIDDDWKSARDIFCTELNPITIGEHEMGDYAGVQNGWAGMHKFSFI